MAVCISFLIGRIGCMLGSNLTGFLLENHCEIAFYISGTLLIGEFLTYRLIVLEVKFFNNIHLLPHTTFKTNFFRLFHWCP